MSKQQLTGKKRNREIEDEDGYDSRDTLLYVTDSDDEYNDISPKKRLNLSKQKAKGIVWFDIYLNLILVLLLLFFLLFKI